MILQPVHAASAYTKQALSTLTVHVDHKRAASIHAVMSVVMSVAALDLDLTTGQLSTTKFSVCSNSKGR